MAGDWNADTDEIDIGTGIINTTAALTLSIWVYIDSFQAPTDARFFSKATGTAADSHLLMLSQIFSGGTQRWRVRLRVNATTPTTDTFVGNEEMPTGQWIHAYLQYDDPAVDLYIDNVADTGDFTTDHSQGGSFIDGGQPAYIGNNEGDDKGPNGALAELSYITQVLPASNRSALSKGVCMFGMVPIDERYYPLWLNDTSTTPDFGDKLVDGTITSVTKRAHPPVEIGIENYL